MTILGEAEIETYWREGWLLLKGLVDPAVCAGAVAAAQAVPLEKDRWTPRSLDPEHLDEEPDLHRLLIEPAVVRVAQTLLGAAPRVLYGMLAVVPAGGGRGLSWHQDNQYALVQGRALNVFVALRPIAPEQCTLWVAPGTHQRGLVASTWRDGHHHSEDPGNGMPMPALAAGDACVFDRNLLHRSLTNQTSEHRYAYAAQFCEDRARDAQGRLWTRWPLAAELAARWHRAAATA